MIITPFLRKNLFEPLILFKSRSPRLHYWRKLEKTQYYSRMRLEEIQWQRLERLWRFLWENNDFYRNKFLEAGLTEKSLQGPDDITKLPILTKEEVRNNNLISKGFQKGKLLHFKTGGSTGKALDIFLTEECSEIRHAYTRRHDRWAGWEPGEPVGAVWGNPKRPITFKQKIFNMLVQPKIFLDTMNITDEAVLEFAREWQSIKPSLLFGHAHSVFILCRKIKKLGITSIRPNAIISSSMMLIPHERSAIEQTFGVKVTDRYGCEEVGLIASECERHKGMHLNIEHLFIEFIKDDGTPANSGEYGRVIVTDLINFAMPFIRYQIEDVGIPSERTCACGRGLPLMEKVVGRTADFLVKKDGTMVAGISLIENSLTRYRGIDQMQIIQGCLDEIKLNIVPGRGYSAVTDQAVIRYFKQVFGDEINITIRKVSKIKPERSGKYRFSICKVQAF